MKTQSSAKPFGFIRLSITLLAAAVFGMLATTSASAVPLTINVVGVDTTTGVETPIAEYRWTVEQDATKASIPGRPADTSNYSFSFHTSYMPVVAAGRVGTSRAHAACNTTGNTLPAGCDPDVFRLYKQALPDLDPSKRYFVSVAAEGFQMGGAPVVFGANGATATVYLNQYPVPTAQVSIFVFNDNNPINGAPDLPQETGLAGFHVHLLEAGGTYGASGGEVTQDAFANPLGTTYDANGDVVTRGSGIILTDANGVALIQNLYPAKYTILIDPPEGSDWHQTSTIEGTRGIDAWVKNNEPSFFQEFGPPGHHVFVGFTKSGVLVPNVLNGSNTVTGRIVNTHHSRPPVFTFFNGAPVTECWVGLNEPLGGRALYATACKKDGTFSIPNVPNGTYELAIWDDPLDMIISATTITLPVPAAPSNNNIPNNLGDLPVSSWFGRYQGRVFQDIDGTGLPYFAEEFKRPYIYVDPVTGLETEKIGTFNAGDLKPPFGAGIANNIRFRDGSIYQSMTTKDDGTFAFTEVFPFFNFMVAEIDYARYKATSATVVVDDGGGDPLTGKINADQNRSKLWNAAPGLFGSNDPALSYDPWTRLNPQQQADIECPPGKISPCYFRTESVGDGPGAILLEAMQTFLGATNHIEWGKTPYTINENGGIAGIVYYGITRAEDDPRYAAAENWEPGIPRVQVNVYLDCDGDGKPDKPLNNGTGLCDPAGLSNGGAGYQYKQPDVDNYPFCWRDPESCGRSANDPQRGPEDVVRSGDGVTFSYGDAFRWGTPPSDTNPTPSPTQQLHWGVGKTDSWDDSVPTGCPDVTPYKVPSTGEQLDCFDGLRNYNQARPAVFDGGFAFGRVAGQAELPMVIGAEGKGTYILEAVAPPGYLHQGNGDKNVVFGDSLKATPAALPHECVGQLLPVPEFLTLFPGEPNPNYSPGATWRKCDMKAVPLVPGLNAAPNFFMFTEAPVAGHGVGFILDDTATEFNYLAPNFGEKYSPPHLPVSVRDWTDREITRVYSDQYGSYNFILPSSFTINPPYPSGVMPSMMVACMNHPGPIADPNDPTKQIVDPFYNRSYTTFCYTLQYLPGKTTYLDTPVLPVSAFAPVTTNPLDCECEDGTPRIASVNSGGDNGPRVPTTGGSLTITSPGTAVSVVNPAFNPAVYYNNGTCPTNPVDPLCATDPNDTRLQKNVTRDYGFGVSTTQNPGSVSLGTTTLTINSWSPTGIVATVPAGASTGQLTITRGDNGKASVVGITVHVAAASRKVSPAGTDSPTCGVNGTTCKTIQAAIEAASPGELITIAPGSYNEYVIMDKRVRLQGWGADSVTINAAKSSTTALATWRARLNAKATANPPTFDLLPGQTLGIDPANNEPLLFGAEEGPGVLVVGRANPNNPNNCINSGGTPLIDGFAITGADAGGGILASGYACGLAVSNNRIFGNYGTYGGGIRIGHTTLVAGDGTFTDAVNRNVNVHHNWVAQNGATEAGGAGGITLGTGADNYVVASNYVCGNFSMADGGGLSQLGRQQGTASIAANKFIFNQTFNQAADPNGGGASIAGHIPLVGGASEGTGSVNISANLFQGNQAGAGAGGALSIARTVTGNTIAVTNNMIVNNVAAYAGGGVALTATVAGVRLVNNTVASNASTATSRQAGDPRGWFYPSLPQVAGIAVLSGSSPTLLNNIVWANRSFVYHLTKTGGELIDPGLTPTPSYRDLGRVAGAGNLAPTFSVLTGPGGGYTVDNNSVTASATNRFEAASSTTLVVKKNEFLSIIDPTQPLVLQDATVSLQSALTADETGNFINVIFSPLTLWELSGPPGVLRADYHIKAGSAAINGGTTGATVPSTDYDGQARVAPIDIGADELFVPPPAKPTLTVLDNFNRANANTLGANWSQPTSGGSAALRVNSNQALCANVTLLVNCTLNGAMWNAPVGGFGTKQAAAFTFASAPSSGSLLVLKGTGGTANVPANYLRARYTGTQVVVETTTNSGVSFTTRGTFAATFALNDTLTAMVDASGTAYLWKTSGATDTFLGSAATTATFAGVGRIGMQIPANARVDNFAGGTVP